DFVQLLAHGFQLLVDLDRLLGHLLVRLLAASHQGEVRTGRDALVAVGVQSDTKQEGLGFFLLGKVRHQLRLPFKAQNSRSKARIVGCWLFVVGCWSLGIRHWTFGLRHSISDFTQRLIYFGGYDTVSDWPLCLGPSSSRNGTAFLA